MTVFAAASDRHCATATSGIDRAIRLSTAAAVLAMAAQTAKNLQGYIGYLLGAGQQLLRSLGYVSLPSTIDRMAKAQLSKIGMSSRPD